ncbi:MAG: hypothetical protein HDR72_00675 [Ruminococcaceae bacterium]|nr:hypothetical protein [Oscillospiraceae bacterium]
MRSTKGYSAEIKWLTTELQTAVVVIGAGTGLSAASGFTRSADRLRVNFADFEEKYGFHDM